MLRKIVSGTALTLLLIGIAILTSNIQPVKASGTIYIRADGSVEGTDKIQRNGDSYVLTNDINGSVVIERDNILLDGAHYTLSGTGTETGIDLTGRNNVTIKNVRIGAFSYGIYLSGSSNNSIVANNITYNDKGIFFHYSASNNNTVSGNNIANNGYGISVWHYSSNNSIIGNIIANNRWYGIDLYYSYKNSIVGNKITANDAGGIDLGSSSNYNVVSENNITANNNGIEVYASYNNIIVGNDIRSNSRDGINLKSSSNNVLRNNTIAGNLHNFGVSGTMFYDYVFINDVDISNTVDGKPIYYWVNCQDLAVPSDAGYVALVNSTKITVEGLELENNQQGVLMAYTANSTITNCHVTNNGDGIFFYGSSGNTISGSTITASNGYTTRPANKGYGIKLWSSSNYNIVSGNNITASNGDGIWLDYSSNNSIIGNTITANNNDGIELYCSDNNTMVQNKITNNYAGIRLSFSNEHNNISKNILTFNNDASIYLFESSDNSLVENNIENNLYGIYLKYSSDNKLYHNNFVNNDQQVYVDGSINVWDDGYPSGGNYWSNYTGVDLHSGSGQDEAGSDGIGDAAHEIDADNRDRYPLMAPLIAFDAGVWNGEAYSVDFVSNSTLSDFKLNVTQKTLSFNVTGEEGFAGFCRVTIPNVIVEDLWQGNFTVLLNGDPWPFRNWTDHENTYIYINYTHSEHQIIIVPEFPSAIILPLFLTSTLLIAISSKRKQKPKLKTLLIQKHPHFSERT